MLKKYVYQVKINKEVEKTIRQFYLWYRTDVGDFLARLQVEMSLIDNEEAFEKYLEGHPPILSVTYETNMWGGRKNIKELVIYDENKQGKKCLEINSSNASDYEWMLSENFAPVGVHYIAVNLAALANAIKHEKTKENKGKIPVKSLEQEVSFSPSSEE